MQVFAAVAFTALALAPWSAAAGTSPAPDASPGAQPDPAPVQQAQPSVRHVTATTPAVNHVYVTRLQARTTQPTAAASTASAPSRTSRPRHATHRTAHRAHRPTHAAHPVKPAAAAQLTRLIAAPDLPPVAAPGPASDSGADGRAAMLAGMALLLVAAVGGSLLRLTTRTPRRGAA